MNKFLLKSLTLFLVIIFFSLSYLSYYGVETSRFDNLIKEKTNKINKNAKLDFKNVKIYLGIRNLNLLVKLQNPKIQIRNDKLDLSKLNFFLSLKSIYSSDLLLEKSIIGFKNNDIKDLTKISSIFLPRIINKRINKIFEKGSIEGEFIIPFNKEGNISRDYGFSGKVLDAKINLYKDINIKSLTTDITFIGDEEGDIFLIEIKKGKLYEIEFANTEINLRNKKDNYKITGILNTKGDLSFEKVKKISKLLDLNVKTFKNISGKVNLETDISFDLSKRFKLKNLNYSTEGKLEILEVDLVKNVLIEEYLPLFKSKITFKDTNIKFSKSKLNQSAELDGLVKISDEFDIFNIFETYNYENKNFNVISSLDLTNSNVNISKINYLKDNKNKSSVNLNINFILNNLYKIKSLIFEEGKNRISLSNIKLNKNFEIEDFEKVEIKTFLNKKKNNDFYVKKSEKITVFGEVFDAQPVLKSLYKKSDRELFSKTLNSEIKINFNKTLTGTEDTISDFALIASINKGSYGKLILKGNFSNEEIVEMSIYQINKDKKTLQIISDRARPFMENFDFIKGFEDGKLQYESTISKDITNSKLSITDFKVSKVPALAKLLTLASLQGIADTLSGEGIRFDSFEMKTNSTGNVLNIEDALAMGPAVSILLDGYVDKGETVSLRGTLVPATKLNAFIAKIPLVGNILVGKKSGEGVVGVSFKMKGHPKDIKTTVNPIKTLTPRFIVRAVEKRKKEKAK